jgi:DNA primase
MEDNRQQIEQIKDRVDIYNLISKYVKLAPKGKNFGGLCPFHQEKTPSFIVSPDIQQYKCFGCGKSGDIYTFLQEIENIDFPEALEKLAKDAGVTLVKRKPTNPIYSKLEEMNKHAANYYYKQLKKDKQASKYIEERNISNEMIKTFGIGYATGIGLKEELQSKLKIDNQMLIKSGLFINKNGTIREKFVKRIMFPIRSYRGKVIGFSGRVLPGNDYGPKYLNSPKTPLFDKGTGVYGIFQSRQEIRKEDLCIFCEGQTDVISAHQNGFMNIVAPLGTAITQDQIKLVARITKNILFLFDSDDAGQKALERA